MLLKYVEISPEKYRKKCRKFSGKIWNFPDNFSASQHYHYMQAISAAIDECTLHTIQINIQSQ